MAQSTTPVRDAVLVKYLNEAYGKEMQLETALQAQIALVSRPAVKKGMQEHLKVTRAQARGLKARIKKLGGTAEAGLDLPGPDALSGAATAAASAANKALAAAKGPIQALRGTSEADNELRNVRDCFWNEAEEIAHYNVIEAVAEELGDKETATLARQYRREEERMQALLAREIPKIVKAVIREEVPKDQRSPASSGSRSTARSATSSSSRSSRTSSTKSAARSTSAAAKRTGTAAKSTGTAAKRTAKTATKSTGTAAKRTAKTATKSTSTAAKRTAKTAKKST